MARWQDWITKLYDGWAIRVSVLLSFAVHVVLILFAGIRRRKATGVRRVILWLAYQLVDSVAIYFLGHLSLGSTSHEQQLVAFWATFVLLHLGCPDNISAYTLEDNMLSGRQVIGVVVQIMGVFYVLWKHIPSGGSGTLFPAAWIMFAVGVAKYVERTLALWWGDLGSIRSSGEKQLYDGSFSTGQRGGWELDHERALQVAHEMFHISKGAFADYSILKDPLKRPGERQSFPHGWKDMCKVVEMELSLMYDILYTKAAMVHTWRGYLLRFVSPPLTAMAFLLFWFYSKDGQRKVKVDIVITYILLAATFLMDLRWLFRALGSTWTYAFLYKMASTRWWCWLRHVVVYLDLCRLLGKEPASYRVWSDTIGQYNLLHECTDGTESLCRTLAKKIRLEDCWNEYQYHYRRGIDISKFKELLLDGILEVAYGTVDRRAARCGGCAGGQRWCLPRDEPARRRRKLDENMGFNPEIGEHILALHIATDIFLLCRNRAPSTYVEAIKAVSNYMVFLIAVRPYMLPGLTLSSLHRATHNALKDIRRCSSTTRENELACKLREMQWNDTLYEQSIILSDGTQYADVLLLLDCCCDCDRLRVFNEVKEMMKMEPRGRLSSLIPGLGDGEHPLKAIFQAWVRMLIYVSIRCSRDSHAKQLSRGGELTTIVWILVEHAGILGMPEQWRIQASDHLRYCPRLHN